MRTNANGAVRQIKVLNQLKAKVGTGGIPKAALEKSQAFVDSLDVDFTGYAQADLEGIIKNIEAITNDPEQQHVAFKSIVRHVMQLKANGSMFGYAMISSVSSLVLDILEKQGAANDDNLQLVQVHNDIVSFIIQDGAPAEGELAGHSLIEEFNKAVTRYCDKYFE